MMGRAFHINVEIQPFYFIQFEKKPEPMTVLYQTAEDGLGDTIKPRLLSAGADCSKVIVIDDREKGTADRRSNQENICSSGALRPHTRLSGSRCGHDGQMKFVQL